jgi:hypothetical protein
MDEDTDPLKVSLPASSDSDSQESSDSNRTPPHVDITDLKNSSGDSTTGADLSQDEQAVADSNQSMQAADAPGDSTRRKIIFKNPYKRYTGAAVNRPINQSGGKTAKTPAIIQDKGAGSSRPAPHEKA